eukprot:5494729-Pleurochrysis_carterae.AAC.2
MDTSDAIKLNPPACVCALQALSNCITSPSEMCYSDHKQMCNPRHQMRRTSSTDRGGRRQTLPMSTADMRSLETFENISPAPIRSNSDSIRIPTRSVMPELLRSAWRCQRCFSVELSQLPHGSGFCCDVCSHVESYDTKASQMIAPIQVTTDAI